MSSLQQNTTLSTPTALDHWAFEHYNFWLESSGVSAGSKMRNRRHLALDLAPSFDLDRLKKAGS